VGIASVLPERFPARARILLDVIKPDPVTGSVIATQFVRSYTKTQIELIKDYRVAGEVVDKLGWATDPVRVAEWRKKTGGEGDLRRYLAQQIIDRTDAGLVETSNILEITYDAPNPVEAKAVVGAIRDAYLDAALRFRTDSAGRTADWYRLQAEKAQTALTAAETAKSNFERANGIVVGTGGVEAETSKLQGLQSAMLAARGVTSSQEFAAAQTAQNTGIVDQLKMQLATVNDTLQQAGDRLGTSHPAYLALVQRRALLTRELASELVAARAVSGGAAASSRKSVAKLESDYNAQKAKVLGMKNTLDQLGALQREVDLRRSQYEKAAGRTADLKLEADVAETGLVNLGDPVGTNVATFPNVPLVWALSILGGLVLGIILAILVELFGRRVRGTEDLQAAARVPVLAVIGNGERSPFRAWLRRILQRRRSTDSAALQPAQ
jgi:succinoglycan biosynthesis transport protein ExoP